MAEDEDDLETLLDEVESKYCRPHTGARAEAGNGDRGAVRPKRTSVTSKDDDVDDLIEDILDVRVHEGKVAHKANAANTKAIRISNQQHMKKCCPVYLGGSSIPFGVGTNVSERACNQLRCTRCDFTVLNFQDYKWDTSCDYLFFRNSMPELSKLQSKLIRRKGIRAYACQCSWRSVEQLTDLSTELQLRWVCGKHSE